MIRSLLPIVLLLLTSCASQTKPDKYYLDLPGPTLAQRVTSGYELMNRHVRVVIDDKTGDAIYWGSIDGKQNLLADQPMRFTIGNDISIADGYIEPRDDQTWQYLGQDDSHHLGWRKIYCLDGDNLNISVLVQNKQSFAIDVTMGLECNAFKESDRKDAERFDGGGSAGAVHLHGYNEFHDKPGREPMLLLSDPHHLLPNERISWTMQWRCELAK